MSLYVYIGPDVNATVLAGNSRYTFDKGIPTWVQESSVKELKKMHDRNGDPIFMEYDPQKEYEIGRPIFIETSNKIEWFFPAISLIRYIKTCYPKNPIICQVAKSLSGIDVECQTVEYIDRRDMPKYYRTYSLNPDQQDPVRSNPIAQSTLTFEQLLLLMIGLYDPTKDQNWQPKSLPGWNKNAIQVTVIVEGDNHASTQEGLGEYFQKQNPDFHVISYGKAIENPIEIWKQFQNSKYIILCGDSPLSMMACYSGAPTFICLKQDVLKRQTQYQPFPQVKLRFVDNKPVEEIAAGIISLIGNHPEVKKDEPSLGSNRPAQRVPWSKRILGTESSSDESNSPAST